MKNGKRPNLLFQGTALTLGTLAQALAGFGTQIVLMRLLMPEDFGRFAIALAGCGLIQTLLSLRLNILIIRLAEDDLHNAALYNAVLVWETAAASALAFLWLAVSGLLSGPILILLTSLTLGHWVNQAVTFYERGLNYARISLVETISQMVGHGSALALVLGGAGDVSLYLRELVITLCRLGAFAAIGALPIPVWRRPSWQAWHGVWCQTRAIWSEGILEGIFTRVVILVTGNLIGHHGAGLFAQSQRLAVLPHQFLSPVMARMSGTLFSRPDRIQDRNGLALRLALVTLMLMLPVVVATWFWAPSLVPWLFGENWNDAGFLLRAMIGVILFMSLFELMRSYCYGGKMIAPVVWARLMQILVFLLPLVWWSQITVQDLAWLLSAAHAAAFAVIVVLAIRWVAAKS